MASLKNIKVKIQSYKKTGTVTKAMQAVSAVKMRKAQERALSARTYAASALLVLERISSNIDVARHPLMGNDGANLVAVLGAPKTATLSCFIIITSDKGLAGALNSSVIRKAEQEIMRIGATVESTKIIAIGRRGADYFASRGYTIAHKFENLSDEVSEETIMDITHSLVGWHEGGEITSAFVIYTNFLSTFEQEAIARKIIPITPGVMKAIVSGIRPARGKYAPVSSVENTKAIPYTIEPDADAILKTLLPKLLTIILFHAVLESKASEHSARMVAMKSATDKAKDMTKVFQRQFNRIRQASITREVSEITSGMEAMK